MRRPTPKDKHDTKWWQKRNAARLPKQQAHAKRLEVKRAEEALIGVEAKEA